ncbi:MAG TPA: transcription antitermination factor NusB [Dehalococcoidia bacterium]|jgi:N utilization substance protein B|nr:transcription antitermination factor NusB [Dehalococcoidia bacterium]
MAGKRRRARIAALQALFELDSVGHAPEETIARQFEAGPASPEVVEFARELVTGVLESKERIDQTIQATAPAFPVEQMAVVDRNILRLAIYEVLIDNRVPMRAAINEAVELAKEFGGENSPKFINGVLGSVSVLTTR